MSIESYQFLNQSDYRSEDEDNGSSLDGFIVSDSDVSSEESESGTIADRMKKRRVHGEEKTAKAAGEPFKRLRIVNDDDDGEYLPSKTARHSKRQAFYGSSSITYLCQDPENSIGKSVVGRNRLSQQIISKMQGTNGRVRLLLIGSDGIGKNSTIEKVAYLLKTSLKHPLWSYHEICCLAGGQLKDITRDGETVTVAEQFENFVKEVFSRNQKNIMYIRDIDMLLAHEKVLATLSMPYPFIASISADPKDSDTAKIIDKLLHNNFERIDIPESSPDNVETIVKNHFRAHPMYPGLQIDQETIRVAVKLADKYIHSSPFPVKAINLLQECANAVLIDCIKRKRVEEMQLTPKDVAQLMEVKTKVASIDLLNQTLFSEQKFSDRLRANLVGQDYAIKIVSETVAGYKMGLADTQKPWGVFLFVGPTGVGKTELAKLLAKQLYQDDSAFIRIDGSEFQEPHSISRLIGSPPGYEGHEAGGQLTEALKRNRHLVVLFDEFEKAHNDVRRLFLHVFDNGKLTDTHGNILDCTQTLFIMTSNLGSKKLFNNTDGKDFTPQQVLEEIKPILINELTPELYNRFSAIIPFQPLKKSHIPEIVEVQLNRIKDRLKVKPEPNIDLSWTKELIDYFANEEFDIRLGMRDFCRSIDKRIVESLKEAIRNFSNRSGGQTFKGRVLIKPKDEDLAVLLKRYPA